ncbi:hypothetical protein [Mycobacterium intracellulare]|uniref:hypothetical protein n=1 Tax=Mycobacterium intracellulare TaxID=1767 RepID=UPI00109E6370|nr:hypothetical protein [Mycobacterium intracellulare]
MGVPAYILQGLSNTMAAYGDNVGLNTGDGGTTGANEATGGGYTRVTAAASSPDGLGDVNFTQVNIPCAGGSGTSYTGTSAWSTTTGTLLSIPSGVTAVGSGTGGTLAAGTWYYVVTAFNIAGETTASVEASATTTGTTSSVTINWSHVTGVYNLQTRAQADAGYRIYRGTASGGENVLVATVAATATTWTDTGTVGTAGTPPASNTAYTFCGYSPFTGGTVTVMGTGASINVNLSTSVTG